MSVEQDSQVDLNDYVGIYHPKPRGQHISAAEYCKRLIEAQDMFDLLVSNWEVASSTGTPDEPSIIDTYSPISLGEHDIKKEVRGVHGVMSVYLQALDRCVGHGREQRQLSLLSSDGRVLGSFAIEDMGPENDAVYINSVTGARLEMFTKLAGYALDVTAATNSRR